MKPIIIILVLVLACFGQIGKNDKFDNFKFNIDSTKIKVGYIHCPAGPFMGGGADSVYPYIIIYKVKNNKIVKDTIKIGTREPQQVTPERMIWPE